MVIRTKEADHITKVRIVSQRFAGVPLESNGIIVIPSKTDHSQRGSRVKIP